MDDSNEKFFVNDEIYNNLSENPELQISNNDHNNNNSLNSKYDDSARINFLENNPKNNHAMSSNLINLFKKLNVKNNYKLCVSGEAFRIIVNKLKNFTNEFEKKKIPINHLKILNCKFKK